MDVYNMYMGDCSTYRSSMFRDYEKFPYGSLEGNKKPQKSYYTMVQEKIEKSKQKAKKEPCPFCQEQKKRPLVAYMRKRAQEKNCKIFEEEEEPPQQQQPDEEDQKVQQENHHHGHHNNHHLQHHQPPNNSSIKK